MHGGQSTESAVSVSAVVKNYLTQNTSTENNLITDTIYMPNSHCKQSVPPHAVN